jgi:hypothetical protein
MAVDVRSDGDVADALCGEPAGVRERRGIVGCSVVHAGKQVEVQIDI